MPVPLLIEEPSTARASAAWNEARLVVSSTIAFVEVHAALAAALRRGRLDSESHRSALDEFATVWHAMATIAISEHVIEHAATLSADHALRGYDALHCATALAAASDDFVAVGGDRDLIRAWSELGVATVDITR